MGLFISEQFSITKLARLFYEDAGSDAGGLHLGCQKQMKQQWIWSPASFARLLVELTMLSKRMTMLLDA